MTIQTDRSVLFSPLKFILMTILIILISTSKINGQRTKEEAPPLKDRLFYGGSFSLQLGSLTNIEVAPVVGIWVLPRIAVAAGPSYRFYKDYGGKTDIYGGRSYIQYVIFRDLDKFIPLGIHTSLFLHCEDEMLSLQSSYWKNVTLSPKRFMINTVLAGPGISQQIGTRSSFNIMVLWTLNDNPGINVYGTPEIKIGFIF
jgi:hypothetical protein